MLLSHEVIIDAQLPFKLAGLLQDKGHDVIHTDNLPHKEKTSDKEIIKISQQENRIVVTKDVDFLNSFYLHNLPRKLLIITTGNIKNKSLFELFLNNIESMEELFTQCSLVELNNIEIIGHE